MEFTAKEVLEEKDYWKKHYRIERPDDFGPNGGFIGGEWGIPPITRKIRSVQRLRSHKHRKTRSLNLPLLALQLILNKSRSSECY